MDYRPIKNAMSYLTDVYCGIKDLTQKIGNSLKPSGLELALAGVPNSVLYKPQPFQLERSKLQGYFFADYGIKSFNPQHRKVIVTRSDGRTIPLDVKGVKEGQEESFVTSALGNNGIHDKSIIRKIANALRNCR